jgi:hypothetical protein
MPSLLTLDSPQSWTRWWEGYVATFLERDLRQVAQIDALLDFRKTIEKLAAEARLFSIQRQGWINSARDFHDPTCIP